LRSWEGEKVRRRGIGQRAKGIAEKTDDPSSLSELRRGTQMTEDGGRKTEDRGQMTEDG